MQSEVIKYQPPVGVVVTQEEEQQILKSWAGIKNTDKRAIRSMHLFWQTVYGDGVSGIESAVPVLMAANHTL